MGGDITQLLDAVREGSDEAREELFRQIIDELHAAAQRLMRRESPDHSWQPTDLMNAAVCKLIEGHLLERSPNRRYLYTCAIRAMRQTLVDYARRRGARKRSAYIHRQPLDQVLDSIEAASGVDVLALEDALQKLGQTCPRCLDVVEYHFFGGFTIRETAELLQISESTVEKDLRFSRAQLSLDLRDDV